MKKSIILAGVIGMFILQSCGNEKKQEAESETMTTDQNVSTPALTASDTSQMQSVERPSQTSGQPALTTVPVSGPAVTAEGMNPAHGEPGHRCDIPVGAPLNSPGGKQPATSSGPAITAPSVSPGTTTPQSIQVTPQAGQTTAGPTPEGMNPPHGQPGHDCSVAVGAPLKK